MSHGKHVEVIGQLWGVGSLPPPPYGDQTQVIRLDNEQLYPSSNFTLFTL